LDHDIAHYENASPSDYIYSILDSFVSGLLMKLVDSPNDAIGNLNNLYLMVGGGSKEENDIVRKGFSLLVNPDAKTFNKLKSFSDDTNINQLFEKLINNITILKAVRYETSNRKESKAMSKHLFLIKI
jgi:hypothetical protein